MNIWAQTSVLVWVMPFGRDAGLSGGDTCWKQCPNPEDYPPSMAWGTVKGHLETVLSTSPSRAFHLMPQALLDLLWMPVIF